MVVRGSCALAKVERGFLKLESLGGPLERAELRGGPQRGVGLREIETLHDGKDLGGDRSERRVEREIGGRTFGRKAIGKEDGKGGSWGIGGDTGRAL